MPSQSPVLIERWLPLALLGAEQTREKSMGKNTFPATVRLHVWWARRPLLVSRAAILASVLPTWTPDWPKHLRERFPDAGSYERWFVRLCGIFGDAVSGRRLILAGRATGQLVPNPYKHPRAFTVQPSDELLRDMGDLLEHAWGKREINVLDPFSGGGSIPFEALRYGFHTHANELNPVASVILEATLGYPFRFGPKLATDVERYGAILTKRVQVRLKPFFTPLELEYPGAMGAAYLWARTVRCPYTGKPIPLSPNWWLAKKARSAPRTWIAARPIFDTSSLAARFEVLRGDQIGTFDPTAGTVKAGNGVSPWAHNQPVDGDYIKSEAQAGRLGQQLYAVAVKRRSGFEFRSPRPEDDNAVTAAQEEMARRMPAWRANGLVPTEEIPDGNKTSEPHRYGMRTWASMYTPRQLLALCTYMEELNTVRALVNDEQPPERARAILTYLAIPLDKAADYNSRMVRWHSGRSVIAGTFDRHDFSFKWSHAEFDAANNLFPWVVEQVVEAYRGLALLGKTEQKLVEGAARATPITISRGGASHLQTIADRTVHHICTDPPYEANVMYAECSDFFYVWMKRTVGTLYPEYFTDELTNKDDEAVSNVARFAAMGKKKGKLALEDYERKMAAAFREMHRVLTDDGVLTVMFTHKKVEAWDTLATSLIGAGFAIHSSWPVHTESEHSLHQAKKNAAQSTILLTCRKREPRAEPVWWDDIKGNVRRVAREKAEEFERQGIRGVDLYIATFGPTLAILSENWPVLTSEVDERTGEPKPLRPEVALDLAREEVVALRKQGLLLGRSVTFDPFTDWYLMAWDAFMAQEFPGDEARKLGMALGLNLEKQIIAEKKLVSKKGKTVTLQQPSARRKRGMVDPDQRTFTHWIDAAHTAMLLYTEDGSQACQHFLRETGFQNDSTFKALIQALLQAIPRTKQKGKFARPEAEVLDAMRLAFFDDLPVPPEEEIEFKTLQGDLFDGASVAAEKPDDDGIEDEDEPDEDEEDDE
jgi:putative DNA methylase